MVASEASPRIEYHRNLTQRDFVISVGSHLIWDVSPSLCDTSPVRSRPVAGCSTMQMSPRPARRQGICGVEEGKLQPHRPAVRRPHCRGVGRVCIERCLKLVREDAERRVGIRRDPRAVGAVRRNPLYGQRLSEMWQPADRP
jgi:hypothetical protein